MSGRGAYWEPNKKVCNEQTSIGSFQRDVRGIFWVVRMQRLAIRGTAEAMILSAKQQREMAHTMRGSISRREKRERSGEERRGGAKQRKKVDIPPNNCVFVGGRSSQYIVQLGVLLMLWQRWKGTWTLHVIARGMLQDKNRQP